MEKTSGATTVMNGKNWQVPKCTDRFWGRAFRQAPFVFPKGSRPPKLKLCAQAPNCPRSVSGPWAPRQNPKSPIISFHSCFLLLRFLVPFVLVRCSCPSGMSGPRRCVRRPGTLRAVLDHWEVWTSASFSGQSCELYLLPYSGTVEHVMLIVG